MNKFEYNYDYTKTMMMKMPMAFPDRKGGSVVENTFEDALEIIKKIDAITLGMPKIIYLVGWQYNGHDDKYPDFFEVNPALKCKDKSPLDSMLWLMREAKKYNTIVSVHINFNDAYENAPSFNRFVSENALIRKRNGKPDAIENYNGLKCYKTSLVEYWESGLFKEMFDRLLDMLPFEEQGTIHVDNFQCYKNYSPDISIKEMQRARFKMLEYVKSRGIDITSEFTYREDERLVNKPIFGLPREHNRFTPIDTLGTIPAIWWFAQMTKKDLVDIPPQLLCGGIYRRKRFNNYLYGNIHGEDDFKNYNKDPNWEKEFISKFATIQLPFQFLCNYKRLAINGVGVNEHCVFSDNVISYNKDRKITVDGAVIKEKDNVLIPVWHLENTYIAYSKNGDIRQWCIDNSYSSADISIYDNGEYKYLRSQKIENGKLKLKLAAGTMMKIRFN